MRKPNKNVSKNKQISIHLLIRSQSQICVVTFDPVTILANVVDIMPAVDATEMVYSCEERVCGGCLILTERKKGEK